MKLTNDKGETVDLTIYAGSEDWSALYLNGELKVIGDHYLVDEAIKNLIGANVIDSDSFLRGGNDRESAAKSIAEISAYERKLALVEAEKNLIMAQEELRLAQNNFENLAK